MGDRRNESGNGIENEQSTLDSEKLEHDEACADMEDEAPKGVILSVPLDKVVPDEEQPRKRWGHIGLMKEALRIGGQIQPITVVPVEDGKYKIINGESRWRAMMELARENNEDASQATIDVLIRNDGFDANTGFLINIVRVGYTPIEIARALKKLIESKKGMTQQEAAALVGKSPSTVAEYLSLLRLPGEVQEDALANNIVPFNKLKQLAARGEMSDRKKIKFYKKLKEEYEKQKSKENEDGNAKASSMGSQKEKQPDSEAAGKEAIQEKKYNVMTRRLDAISNALMKFRPENIRTPEEKDTLNAKLDMIITNAQGMKARINQ